MHCCRRSRWVPLMGRATRHGGSRSVSHLSPSRHTRSGALTGKHRPTPVAPPLQTHPRPLDPFRPLTSPPLTTPPAAPCRPPPPPSPEPPSPAPATPAPTKTEITGRTKRNRRGGDGEVPTSEKSPAAAYGSSPAHARTSSAESPETSSKVPTGCPPPSRRGPARCTRPDAFSQSKVAWGRGGWVLVPWGRG